MGTVSSEIRYRGIDALAEDVLRDTLEAAACIVYISNTKYQKSA